MRPAGEGEHSRHFLSVRRIFLAWEVGGLTLSDRIRRGQTSHIIFSPGSVMVTPDPNPLDDQFARLLAAHDEELLTGRPKPDEPISPDLAARLNQARAFVEVLDGAWRRSRGTEDTPPGNGHSDDLTVTEEFPAAVGRFQIVHELGRGGGGVVYLAHDPALGRQVAVKVPRLEIILTPALRRRFLREGQAAALLNHPNINPIHEAGSAGSVCYIVSSYCSGPTLAQWLRDHPQPVAPRDAASLIERLAEAMAHAHQRGILHRDLKPSNILLESGVVTGKDDPTHHSPLHPSPPTNPRSPTSGWPRWCWMRKTRQRPASFLAQPRTWLPSRRAGPRSWALPVICGRWA
jgi:hypothetical protein